ncbi:MAG: DNA polymerase Y family protein [Myxococcales bacterium]|nr:DNA polymerase Y family protein [Myxococcales bacterium]
MRALALYLPAFRLERCGFDAAEPAGLIDEVKNAMRLVALTPAALAEGLRVGMTATAARALLPGVALEELDAVGEAEDRAALQRAFDAVCDDVTFPFDDVLVLQIQRVSHLFGGEHGIAARVLDLATELGHRARVAVADDPQAALALAQWVAEWSEPLVAPRGEAAGLLAPLPVESLRSEALADALRSVGIATVGQLAALDPASVAGRYGPEAMRLQRVARGLRGSLAHLVGQPPDGDPRVGVSLASATTLSELHFVLPGLLAQLVDLLASRDLAVVRLRVVLELESVHGRGVHTEVVRVGRPTRNQATLERLIRQALERVRLSAPVERLVLDAVEVVPEQGWQPGLADRAQATEPLPDLLARLADQLGEGALFAARLVDAWRPDAAWSAVRFPPTQRFWSPSSVHERMRSEDPVEIQEAFEGGAPLPRPTLLLDPPVSIEVQTRQLRDGYPCPERVFVGTRRSAADEVVGPERLTGCWWDPRAAFERTYWQVRVEGRRAWIFQESRRWFLHGWFD